jgi:hypothetical protein
MARSAITSFFLLTLDLTAVAQTPKTSDIEAQLTAMKKLAFLVGEWSGEASALRAPGTVVELNQSETAQFKVGGLVLMIEGIGRTKSDGKLALQALGLISFDDASGTYHMRGFPVGDSTTKSVLRINDKGEWTEQAEIAMGGKAPQKLMELVVRRSAVVR